MKQNILIDILPDSVNVNGQDFSVNSDFRTMILFENLINDLSVPDSQKIPTALNLFYSDKIPKDFNSAVMALLKFYRSGNSEKPKTDEKKKKKNFSARIYDFEYDADYIYAAFLATYGIDLNDIENLHWWKFKALFNALPDNVMISKIMSYRATDLNQIKNTQERSRIARLKAIYALPSNLSEEEKVSAAGAIFGGMR